MSDINIIKQTTPYKSSAKIAIVASRFNSFVVERLYDGAIRTLNRHGIENSAITVAYVPGAFEIPVVAKAFLDQNKFDAVITLGAVIRGETPHFDYICNECAHGIARLAVQYTTPVIFGVLTVDNVDQAMDRTGEDESNKGAEAALAALETLGILEHIRS